MDLSNQDDAPACRICHCAESPSTGLVKLISPCHCSGSLEYVHHSCLQQWLDATNSQKCELCKHPFRMKIKYKPLYKWRSLNASPSERRRLICNSVFNLVSMVCIFWSIYVLIERASSDAKNGQIDWNFYVKISVVTIGLIIGVIFLFVQLKLYFSIFMKWRQSNRIIIIRNANFKDHNNSGSSSSSNASRNNVNSTSNARSDSRSNQPNSASGQNNNNNISRTGVDSDNQLQGQERALDHAGRLNHVIQMPDDLKGCLSENVNNDKCVKNFDSLADDCIFEVPLDREKVAIDSTSNPTLETKTKEATTIASAPARAADGDNSSPNPQANPVTPVTDAPKVNQDGSQYIIDITSTGADDRKNRVMKCQASNVIDIA